MNWRDAVAEFWIKNAMARHGVLPGDPKVTADAPAAKVRSGLLPAVLAAALTAAGLPIAGGLVNWYFSKEATPPAATVEHDGSLYQYLEDNNLHLPAK